jgi:hypothetical protein
VRIAGWSRYLKVLDKAARDAKRKRDKRRADGAG